MNDNGEDRHVLYAPPPHDENVVGFYERHRGGVGPVVHVYAYNDKKDDEKHAIFSTVEGALDWIMMLRAETEDWQTVTTPLVVDMPHYGDVPKEFYQ
jgi:hypothetical protein